MPRIWRGMNIEGGLPALGNTASTLGVRIGDGQQNDIPAVNGQVQPGTGGLSVSPGPATLPFFRIPRRLGSRFPGATGKESLHLWSMGEGDFVAETVAPFLVLRIDPEQPERHGFVEPETAMTAEEYLQAITATRLLWMRMEE